MRTTDLPTKAPSELPELTAAEGSDFAFFSKYGGSGYLSRKIRLADMVQGVVQKIACRLIVRFDPSRCSVNGARISPYVKTVLKGVNQTRIDVQLDEGYQFKSWSDGYEQASRIVTDIQDAMELTLATSAVGTAEVIFDDNMRTVKFWADSALLSEQRIRWGQAAAEPSAPSKEGYRFTGWDKDFLRITEDTDIHAQFEEISKKVIRFFTCVNGPKLAEYQVTTGSDITSLYPVRSDIQIGEWNFLGWNQYPSAADRDYDIIGMWDDVSNIQEKQTSGSDPAVWNMVWDAGTQALGTGVIIHVSLSLNITNNSSSTRTCSVKLYPDYPVQSTPFYSEEISIAKKSTHNFTYNFTMPASPGRYGITIQLSDGGIISSGTFTCSGSMYSTLQ